MGDMMRTILMLLLVTGLAITASGATDPYRKSVRWTVDVNGVERTAVVYPGARAAKENAPLVFAFHGFGGHPLDMAANSRLHVVWPEATVVYPLGLTKWSKRWEKLVPAWQVAPGVDGDRDVRFIDALLAGLGAQYHIDHRRVYAAGSSNGAMFCYVLLATRPEKFAAFACVAGAVDFLATVTTPRPILLIHGIADLTVPFEKGMAIRDQLRKLNGCGADKAEWRPGCFSYQPCATGQPVLWRQHLLGHLWPSDSARLIVPFFQEHALPK